MKIAVQNKMTALITAMIFMFSALFVVAAFGTETSYAETGYKYTVTVYSGRVGDFTGGKVWSRTYSRGDRCEISAESIGLKITDDRYYFRGFRIAGHDNNDTAYIPANSQVDGGAADKGQAPVGSDVAGDTTGAVLLNFTVTEDVSFKIAYGIKGKLVGFKVNYVDENGNKLQSSETYYGMPGDKPVAAYKKIDGMQPDAYNIGRTLSENEEENEFTFVYKKAENKNSAGGSTEESGNSAGGDEPPGYKDLDSRKSENVISRLLKRITAFFAAS